MGVFIENSMARLGALEGYFLNVTMQLIYFISFELQEGKVMRCSTLIVEHGGRQALGWDGFAKPDGWPSRTWNDMHRFAIIDIKLHLKKHLGAARPLCLPKITAKGQRGAFLY